ncbi:MAG: hypothetical protein ACPK85_13925 [Methanosarcina sp.]
MTLADYADANIQRNYLQAIKAFCEFKEKKSDELILEVRQEIKSYLFLFIPAY